MKAVILAAGQGLRLRQHHQLPKGLLQLGEQPIILESIAALNRNGIRDILLVTGYASSHYDALAKQTGLFSTAFNEKFASSGSLYSLYSARHWLNDDFLLLESDLIYQPKAITALLKNRHSNCILVSGTTNSGDEVYVEAQQQYLRRMSKNKNSLNTEAILGEFVGINKLAYSTYQQLLKLLEKNLDTLDRGNYEEDGLVLLAQSQAIACEYLPDLLWAEIDNQEHLTRAKHLYTRMQKISANDQAIAHTILLNPGPVTTSNTVKLAQIVPDICHREAQFANTIQSIRQSLLTIVGAGEDYSSILFAASGTGAIEACISSVVNQQKKILVLNNGSYGQRMLDIARRYKIHTVELTCAYDQPVPMDQFEAILLEDPSIEYVAVVHHETSSGILNPIHEIGQLCHRLNRYFIIDAMSSYAGAPINVYADHIDFLISSSNKCLHGMPGVSFVIAKLESLQATVANARSYYFDLHQQYRSLDKEGVFAFTPPVQVLYSLAQALRELAVQTVIGRIQHYHQLYDCLISGLQTLGFRCVTPINRQSKLLATIAFPNADYDFDHFHDYLYARGYTIYPKKLSIPNTFRLSCIGELTLKDIEGFLEEVKCYQSIMTLDTVG